MNNKYILILIAVLVAVLLIGWFAYSQSGVRMDDDAMMEKEGEMMEDDAMENESMSESMEAEGEMEASLEGDMIGGSYEEYAPEKLARAEDGKVVLFFRASWCPTCRILDSNIRSNLGEIPDNVTILDVNYDTEAELKQKYGVTYQHTLVQVDAEGNQIAKWTGSPTLAALLSNVR